MDIIKNCGFFPEYYIKIKELCSESDVNNFNNLKSDLERIVYMGKMSEISENKVQIKREYTGKSEKISLNMKENANAAFRNKQWPKALLLYSKSYIAMPREKASDISILLANRSAALFHMNKFNDALADIKRAVGKGYPQEILYKLYERSAQCHLANKNLSEALESFKKTITALDDATTIPLDKRSTIERNAMIMIKMLEKDKSQETVKVNGHINSDAMECVSDGLVIDYNEQEGRYATAKRNIEIGEEIIVEKPYTFALLEKYCKTHCQNCFKRTIIPLACPECADVIFCSEACLHLAISTYHKFECGILPILWRSGASINCLMALRMTASNSLHFYLKNLSSLSNNISLEELTKLPSRDYKRVYNLIRHENNRTGSSFFQYSLMALFLNDCLVEANYYEKQFSLEEKQIVGSLILRNLQIMQYNTHEIFELHKSESGSATKTVFIGGGIYPTLALFNHSCDPGILKYFNGTTVCVHAVKPIGVGQTIAENYGPLYTQETRLERKSKMKDLYLFDCQCTACIEDWPKFEDMRSDIIRFRCDSDRKCSSIIEVPANCNDFMVKCNTCGQHTNLLKALKVMQDSEMIDKVAKRLYQSGDVRKALVKYIDLLKIMNEVVAPPFHDYSKCQQNIKDCFLHLGNTYISS